MRMSMYCVGEYRACKWPSRNSMTPSRGNEEEKKRESRKQALFRKDEEPLGQRPRQTKFNLTDKTKSQQETKRGKEEKLWDEA